MDNILDGLDQSRAQLLDRLDSCFGELKILDDDRYRYLLVDDVVQSVMDIREPARACLPHAQWLGLSLLSQPSSILMAGLGGGDIIRHFRAAKNSAEFSCCEPCPQIIHAYQQYFAQDVKPCDVELLQEDINDFIPQCQRQFDLIIVDVFTGDLQPDFLTQEAFYQESLECLSDQGIMALNVKAEQQESLLQLALMLRRVFSKKLLMIPVAGCDNIIMFAFKGRPFGRDSQHFLQRVEALNKFLPQAILIDMGIIKSSNVCTSYGDLELWELP